MDDAIHAIVYSGPNTIMAKVDIKSAFRLIPVHLADRHLLAMKWRDKLYVTVLAKTRLVRTKTEFNFIAAF